MAVPFTLICWIICLRGSLATNGLSLGLLNQIVARQTSIADCAVDDLAYKSYGNMHKTGGILVATGLQYFPCVKLCVDSPTCLAASWSKDGIGNCYHFITHAGTLMSDSCCIFTTKICQSTAAITHSTPAMPLPPASTPSTTPSPATPTPVITLPPTTPAATTADTATTATTATEAATTTAAETAAVTDTAATTEAVMTVETTAVPETTAAIDPDSTTQNPADICSSGFQIIPNQRQNGGYRQPDTTVESCKQSCRDDILCRSVDFNKDAPVGYSCFKHPSIVEADIMDDPSSTRFIKVSCQPKTCYEHAAVDLAALEDIFSGTFNLPFFLDTLNIRPGGLTGFTAANCSGACVTEVTADFSTLPYNPYTISRRCDTSLQPVTSKACTETIQSGVTTKTCLCYGDICNAFGPDLIESCVAYYAFDVNAEESTLFSRDGSSININYDAVDTQKNFSARFEGDGHIKVNSFKNFPWGQLPSFGQRTPGFTITFWLKRTGSIGRQAVLNNGPLDKASISLYTEPDPSDAGSYIVVGEIQIGRTVYTVQSVAGKAQFGEWHFVALVVTNSPLLSGANAAYYVQLFVDDLIIPPASDNTTFAETTVSATELAQGIDHSPHGLSIGSQGARNILGVVAGVDVFFFQGLMDELYLFSRGLSMAELESIKSVSSTMGLFLS